MSKRAATAAKQPKTSQSEQALLFVRAQVLRGELHPGEPLAELDLAAQAHLSVDHIRQAFHLLAMEGLLQRCANGKYITREFSDRDIYDALELQSVLEGAAARLAAMRFRKASELKPIRLCHDQMCKMIKDHQASPSFWSKPSRDLIRYARLNASFHQALVNLAQSCIISSAVERIHAMPFSSPRSVTIPVGSEDIPAIAMEQHGAIIEAIADRQPDVAERLARQHVLLALRNVELDLEGMRLSKNKASRIALIKAGA
jgi:GntR family transcriptional regulator, vanillate catabolism transcriptional regulator